MSRCPLISTYSYLLSLIMSVFVCGLDIIVDLQLASASGFTSLE